jgi:hypothetical protein
MWSVTRKAIVLAAGLVMVASGTARAATVDARVPFAFIVEGHTLPAGQYRVESELSDPSVLLIRGENGSKASMFVLTRPAAGHDPAGDTPSLTFDRYENQYRLVSIWESKEQGQEITPVRSMTFAQTSTKAAPVAAKHTARHTVPTHATRGVVKSMDTSTLVITRTGKMHGDMTFALNSTTHLQGTVAVGTPVSVRYREDAKTYVATAVTAQPTKPQAVHAAAPKP